METAELFVDEEGQAVRLPKECEFKGDEVGIKILSDEVIILYPREYKLIFEDSVQ